LTVTLLLVRHAASVPPTPGGPSEHERPLSALGLAQADALAPVVAAYGPSRVLSSPYLRAVQTVAPAAERLGLPVEPRDALREWASGIGPDPHWQRHYRHCWDDAEWATPTGETHEALERRVLAALDEIASETGAGETTVVASHGTWISRGLRGLGHDVDADFWFAMPMPAVYVLRRDGDATSVEGPGL
jgi:2,3-bisphosphoglycerate-dependent phosphoglycerate mutase